MKELTELSCRTEVFFLYWSIFFPVCVRELNNFGKGGAKSIKQYISMIMQFFKSKQRSLFSIHDQIGVNLLKRLQLKFSHLGKHKFCHKFKDCVSPMCNCGTEIETIKHFFLALPIPSQWKSKSPWRPLSDIYVLMKNLY